MTEKFQNKYRISPARLQHWDYGWNAPYFVTICTKNREHFFREIINESMHLNDLGILAEKYWLEIPKHFSFIELGNFVIMPNHVHGILIINKPDNEPMNIVETPKLGVSTDLQNCNALNSGMSNAKWKPATIGVIINQYKRIVTIQARKFNPDFAWQTRFHDHIIRNEISFNRISDYILNNPANWTTDKFFS